MIDALSRLPVPQSLLRALLLTLGLVVAPHLANVHWAALAVFFGAAVWRLLIGRRITALPGRWLMFAMLLGGLWLVVITTGFADGRRTGTALLIVMLGLKLLETRARRDLHIAVFLGYFVVLTHFLYRQDMLLALPLLVGVAALATIHLGLNRVRPRLGRQARSGARLLIAAIPFALVAFVLFPRLPTPLWSIDTTSGVTGISDHMSLGDIGRLSQSEATAFRVRFLDDEGPDPAQRYWRGPVLWRTDGASWFMGKPAVRTVQPLATPDLAPLRYEVTLEPTGEYWLFGLDIVVAKPPSSHLNSNYSLVGAQRVNRRRTYEAISVPDYRIDALAPGERPRALQVPDTVSDKVRALAETWRSDAGADNPAAIVASGLRHFREQPFVYTLSPGAGGDDPIETFLFQTRRGFCEHYAGSFALLMRLAGVPARVIIGYQGGTPNPHGEHWVIRQSDAHAWVEVWIDGMGWQRVDPTAAVAPERIEQSIDSGRSQTSDRVQFGVGDLGLFKMVWLNARWMVDAADLGWHRWVVGFTAERQESLLQRLGLEETKGLGLVIAFIVGGGFAAMAALLLLKLRLRPKADELPAIWRRFTSKLRRAGVAVSDWQGPETRCTAAAERFPRAAPELRAITHLYVQLRYGGRSDAYLVKALRRRVRELRLDAPATRG